MKDIGKGKNFKQERTRIYDSGEKDAYKNLKKPEEPAVCKDCGALFTNGRWTWDDIPDTVNEAQCPACKRIKDKYPAGYLTIYGSYLELHREEIMNMIRSTGNLETSLHPLERIIDIRLNNDNDSETLITTTGIHIARRIGDSLLSSYKGELNYNYEGETLIRVKWHRD